MKHKILRLTIACCMAGSLFAGTAIARQAGGDAGLSGAGNGGPQPPAPGYQSLSPTSRPQQSERLSQLMGATVKDQQGNSIGQINDFVVNPVSGRIQFAIISLNDQSGKLTAVPWQLVRPGADPTVCIVTAGKDKLENAQTFDASSWPDFTQPSTSRDIYSHYGVQPMQGGSQWRNQGGTGEQNGQGAGTGTSNTGNSGNNTGGTGNSGTSNPGNYGNGNNGNSGNNNNNPRNP